MNTTKEKAGFGRRVTLGVLAILFPLALVAVSQSQDISRLALASPAPFTTIQGAVNAASAGETIIVKAGSYPETVRITKDGQTLKCEQSRKCTVKSLELWGNGGTVEGFVTSGGLSQGVEVRQHNNTVRDIEITNVLYDFGLPRGQGATVGITFFGTGHVFENIYIHDLDQYHVDDLGYTEPHQDCFITWKNDSRGGSGAYITINNVLCDMPQAGDSFISKTFASSGGSHHWTVTNLVTTVPLLCLFYDEAHHINISHSTFIGMGVDKPQGCKFLKLNANPAPHDNSITYSIFQNITGTAAIYNYVTGSNNCFWQVANHTPDPGDVFANPLLLPDWNVPANSPCAGMGANLSVTSTPTIPATPTRTLTPIPATITPSSTPTATWTPTKTPTQITPTLDCRPLIWGNENLGTLCK